MKPVAVQKVSSNEEKKKHYRRAQQRLWGKYAAEIRDLNRKGSRLRGAKEILNFPFEAWKVEPVVFVERKGRHEEQRDEGGEELKDSEVAGRTGRGGSGGEMLAWMGKRSGVAGKGKEKGSRFWSWVVGKGRGQGRWVFEFY
ncbi:ethylene-responsive transcription factor 5-like [Pyrus x bretschneideri]|uniref:ethylene-responsive transcription factor 5-like n=1 Tax=Pyrus x bretschneideri TaxID=225117 RepID=UPI00202F0F1C|nr:ethylene-responsive transcription factor 5-like [Pyrus x bretschneideri]